MPHSVMFGHVFALFQQGGTGLVILAALHVPADTAKISFYLCVYPHYVDGKPSGDLPQESRGFPDQQLSAEETTRRFMISLLFGRRAFLFSY